MYNRKSKFGENDEIGASYLFNFTYKLLDGKRIVTVAIVIYFQNGKSEILEELLYLAALLTMDFHQGFHTKDLM